MANALACEKCGNIIASDRLRLDFDGNCPWCLAAFALVDPPQDDRGSALRVPSAKASDRLGKYLLTEKLGTGGMGEVWKALDTELNRWVALKFLKDQDPKELARFAREAQMSAKLSHPNIAAVHEIGEIGGRHYIAMQCIEGRTLETFPRNDRRLLVRLCLDAAWALHHAHRHGVIHRDVKPGNLMVEETDEGMKVVVLDFGLARSIEGGEKLSVSGSVVGTPQYLSPEQARVERLDERTDVYSLGVTMYEIFTGKTPFDGANVYDILKKIENAEPIAPRKIKPQINQDLQTIILKCLEKNRERRYAGAKDLASDLRRFLNHEAVLARPPSTIYRLKMRLSKRKSLVAAVAALLCLVVGSAIVVPKMIAESAARARIVEYQTPYTEGRNAWDEVLQIVQKAPLEHAARKAREARKHFEKAIGILELAEAQVMRGKCLQLEGSPQEAEAAWERALELDPGNQEARFHLAKMLLLRYYNAQSPALAQRDKTGGGFRILETGPETPEETRLRARAEKLLAGVGAEEKAAYLRGVLEVNRRRYKEGAALLAQYNREGWDAASIALEGSARLHSGDYDGAIRVCTRAIELEPRNGHTFVIRGLAKESKGLHEAAMEDYTEAIKLDPKNAGAWHNRGNTKNDQERPGDAIVDYNEAIRLDRNLAVAWYSRGNARSALGLQDAAIEDFNEAIKQDSKFAWAWHNRGCALAEKGLRDKAIADFNEAIRLDPNHADAYYNRGIAKLDKGLTDEAIADYTEAIKRDPKSAKAWNNRGSAKGAQGLHDEAISDCTEAIRLDPKHAKAFNNRGIAKRDKGLSDEAIADFDEAIKLEPKLAVAYSNRGSMKQGEGLLEEAIADINEALRLNPKLAEAYVNRGAAKRAKGQQDAAIEDFTEAIRLEPRLAVAWSNRGNAKLAKGLYDAAMADYAEAIRLDPKDAKGYYTRGNAKRDKGLLDEAIADFTEAIKRDPKHAEAYTNRGNLKAVKGLSAEAMADYDEAIRQNPKLALAYFNRGSEKREMGLQDEAIADLTKAIEYDSRLTPAWYNRGNAKSAQGRHEEAIADFTQAITLDPKFAEAHANRGYAKARLGLIDEAIADWRKSLEVAPRGWSYRTAVQGHISNRGAVVVLDEADRFHGLKKYREAIALFKGLVESHSKTHYAASSAYGIACGYALLGEEKTALDWLEKAVEMGWTDLAHLEKDSDLESLRKESRYKNLTGKLRTALADPK